MNRVVLDTNVVVSALLKPGSVPDIVFQLILNSQFEFVVCYEIMAEYFEVLMRPKFAEIPDGVKAAFFEYLEFTKGRQITPIPTKVVFDKDPADKVFYDLAVTADALLITGNIKHFPADKRVLTPAQLVDKYLNSH